MSALRRPALEESTAGRNWTAAGWGRIKGQGVKEPAGGCGNFTGGGGWPVQGFGKDATDLSRTKVTGKIQGGRSKFWRVSNLEI